MSELSEGLRRDAELVAAVCMSVEPDDVVTIITDDAHMAEANALAQVVVERGGFPVIANNEHQVRRGKADTRFPMAPPRNLHEAMVKSDEIIIITDLEWANRFAHVSAVRESCDNNAKIASVEEGIGSWDLTEADIRDATDRAKAAIEALQGAKWCRVTSPAGTDVRVSIEGRPALEVTPIKKRGQMMGPVPLWSEVAFAAVEDRTEGVIVVDGIMLGIGLPGQTPNPITWKVENGRVTEITGGEEAEKLKQVIDGVPGATVIGEFAFGT
ncbi:MAG: aminopeptidase, partial [Thermomicrobiales bacterium]|nr:aminopeptidase [Thermomicrobiales bacterium]